MENTTKYLTADIIPALKSKVDAKQDLLVSGTNIKTINGESILEGGNLEIVDKLYSSTGQNTDGAMTQKAVTDALADVPTNDAFSTLEDTVTEQGTKITDLETAAAKTVQFDTKLAEINASTVTLVKTTGALDATETTDTSIALPVASATSAGVMNPTIYETIQDNAAKIEAMENGSVVIDNLAADADQAALTAAWKEATGLDELMNGARIYDKANGKIWTYYNNATEWEPADVVNPELVLNNFTNTQAGIIKGSATGDGKVFAEADGTGSVLGWDTLSASVATNTSSITALQTGKQDTLVSGTNLKTVNGESLLGAGDIEIEHPEAMTVAEFETAWANANANA